jgi:putative hemolysin
MFLAATVIVIALILINAIYVAAEFASVSVRRSQIRHLAADGNVLASWLLPVIESPAALDRYIAACQIGITLSSLVLGAYGQATLAVWLTPWFAAAGGLQDVAAQSTAAGVVLIVLTVAQVVFGELVPKSLALQYPIRFGLYTVLPMAPSLWIFYGLIKVLNGSGLLLLRLLGAPQQTHSHIHSPDEIKLLIAESRDGGLLEPDEHGRLQRALRLELRQARQLMVPRVHVSALEASIPLTEALGALTRTPYSRLPVYRGSIDNIVGILHTKDLVRRFVEEDGQTKVVTLEDVMQPVTSIHESVTADRLVKQLRESRTHQALVVDEFGGTAGIITLEDVLAELLGDVGDEFKTGDGGPEALVDGRIRLPGDIAIDEARLLLGAEFETEATTVGGLVTSALGHLPSPGEQVMVSEVHFEVERVAHRAVASVIASRPPQNDRNAVVH